MCRADAAIQTVQARAIAVQRFQAACAATESANCTVAAPLEAHNCDASSQSAGSSSSQGLGVGAIAGIAAAAAAAAAAAIATLFFLVLLPRFRSRRATSQAPGSKRNTPRDSPIALNALPVRGVRIDTAATKEAAAAPAPSVSKMDHKSDQQEPSRSAPVVSFSDLLSDEEDFSEFKNQKRSSSQTLSSVMSMFMTASRQLSQSEGPYYPSLERADSRVNDDGDTDLDITFYATQVIQPYRARQPDELDLDIGDIIHVVRVFEDGWGKGRNATSGNAGIFPVVCLASI
ncbi:fus1 actin binding activity protein [Polyrhizophydium stewartii]|uniref:Fus1 actin binding activity protein n=1 Tax=Polyrhizophydium stewartii TaxID=2732419 RepID=A0ABR4N1L9_9FUNG